jgi:hypothetical protein
MMFETAYEIDREFWGDRLEVDVDLLLQQHADDDFMKAWAARMKKRARNVLASQLNIDTHAKINDVRAAILTHRASLIPYRLAEAAVAGKRSFALLEVARAKLDEDELERCHESKERYDRIAVAWLLFEHNETNLELVFHLDSTQRKGFARMVLEQPPRLNGTDLTAFFTKEKLQNVLDEYESNHKSQRQSHCAAVLQSNGNYRVFIKRDLKPGFISHGAKNTFGFEREWIVLEFEPDMKRVLICSVSPDAPLNLANWIAGNIFHQNVEYVNESISINKDHITDFLTKLSDSSSTLPLVEVTAKNSGMEGSPQIRLNNPTNSTIAPALQQFSATYGNTFDDLEYIESIKVFAFHKRIKMLFERLTDATDVFVVRYADQPLNSKQRREFEAMINADFGITLLSTEKKYVH